MWNTAVIARFADLWTNLLTRVLADSRAQAATATQDNLLWPTLWRFGQKHRADLTTWWQTVAAADDDGSGAWVTQPAGALAEHACRWLRDNNQFGPSYGAHAKTHARGFCLRALQACVDALQRDAPDAAPPHTPLGVLRAGVAALLTGDGSVEPTSGEIVCSEYSAALQLEILGLDWQRIQGPVLDVGCGEHATLVQALRERGVEAFGIDPLADAPGAVNVDWHGCDFGTHKWGTIVSHQAFSLHFLHHHLVSEEKARLYAQTTMRLLRALRPGGVFAYAPGLPFLEACLPAERYVCRAIALPAALQQMPPLRALETATGLSVAHAMQIRVRDDFT